MSKSFSLAVEEATSAEYNESMPFQVEGSDEQLYAYRPTEGQVALLLGAGAARPEEMASTFMELFWSLMDEETAAILRHRLMDRHDRFGLADIVQIVEWIVEEATGFPTQPPPASTRSPATSGQRSTATARQRASTRSRSPRAASAT